MDTRNSTEETPLNQDNFEDVVIEVSQENLETHLDVDTRQKIFDNLIRLNINEDSINRILDAVERMPGKDHIKGALRFLTQLKEERSAREEYYKWSEYVAEFFCTVSNIGLFAVGAYSVRFSILTAGTFSALSHAFPLQRFQQLDYLSVLGIFVEAVTEYKAIAERPIALAWGAGALAIAGFDNLTSFSDRLFPGCKKKCDDEIPAFKDCIAPSLHSNWHLAAAIALLMFYENIVEVTHREPGQTEQTIAMIWGCIGIGLCLLAVAEAATRKIYHSCTSTFFSNNNQNNNDSSYAHLVEDTHHKDTTSVVVRK